MNMKGSRLKLGLLLWAAGMLGVVSIVLALVPPLAAEQELPVATWLVMLASIAQSGLLLAVAVWVGTALAPATGLGAPAFEALAAGTGIAPALRPQLRPGLLGGIAGGILLLLVGAFAPAALTTAPESFQLPIHARVLYGGITEELFLRWGLMTLLVWLGWRFAQGRQGAPGPWVIGLAVAVSALLFGVGHLPAAAAMVGELDGGVVSFIVLANALFGLLFGYLYWRHGLESAIVAHGGAHLLSYLAELAGHLIMALSPAG